MKVTITWIGYILFELSYVTQFYEILFKKKIKATIIWIRINRNVPFSFILIVLLLIKLLFELVYSNHY